MKLYTKVGDKGVTNLYDMRKVSKNNPIIHTVGELDELSANIGMLISRLEDNLHIKFLRWVQSRLLDIGSDFATTKNREKVVFIKEEDTKKIEGQIDLCEEKNSPLTEFILPGSNEVDSQCHICRAVCRRLERNMVSSKEYFDEEEYSQGDNELEKYKFINRLSDYFFALSRNLACEEIKRSQADI
jgi:cob(I)alamin adenosyltransferase